MEKAILEDVFVFVSIIVAMGCFTGIITSWIRRRARADVPSSQVLSRLEEIADRLSRLDGSIDTMAVEVERISEAQRFTARVLAERHPPPALPDKQRAPGSVTPH